jgi:hypothetical protein
MNETMERCEDSCIVAQNMERAMYYKWLQVDGLQRNLSVLEVVRIG